MRTNEITEINKIIEGMNLSYNNLEDMERGWKNFVQQIIDDGYDDYLVEFDNDASVRDNIEKVLRMPSLQQYETFKDFKMRIEQIDGELKNCFMTNAERTHPQDWWNRGIVKNGSGNYMDDIKELGYL